MAARCSGERFRASNGTMHHAARLVRANRAGDPVSPVAVLGGASVAAEVMTVGTNVLPTTRAAARYKVAGMKFIVSWGGRDWRVILDSVAGPDEILIGNSLDVERGRDWAGTWLAEPSTKWEKSIVAALWVNLIREEMSVP